MSPLTAVVKGDTELLCVRVAGHKLEQRIIFTAVFVVSEYVSPPDFHGVKVDGQKKVTKVVVSDLSPHFQESAKKKIVTFEESAANFSKLSRAKAVTPPSPSGDVHKTEVVQSERRCAGGNTDFPFIHAQRGVHTHTDTEIRPTRKKGGTDGAR